MRLAALDKTVIDSFKNIKLGLGISTYNRPQGLSHALNSALDAIYCGSVPYEIFVADDGSDDAEQISIIEKIRDGEYNNDNISVKCNEEADRKRVGVANNKNRALRYLFGQGCDYIVIMEDDAYIKDPRWFVVHVLASQMSDIHHFNFVPHSEPKHVGHVHGVSPPYMVLGEEIHTAQTQHTTGIFLFFTRACMIRIGGFDSRFGLYGFEHVELSDRARHPLIFLTPPNVGYASLLECEKFVGWDTSFPALFSEEEKAVLIPQQRELWDMMRKQYSMGFMYRGF